MKLRIFLAGFILLGILIPGNLNSSLGSQQSATSDDSKLLYADFEKVENGRAVSNGGGLIQIFEAHESTPNKYKGIAGATPAAPEVVRLPQDPSNHLGAFDYTLTGPNQWANVTLEIQGKPTANGKFVSDDVSHFKSLSMQLYATGIEAVRVELISHGQGIEMEWGYPQMVIRLKPGFNTYLLPLSKMNQPNGAPDRVDVKEMLKKVTAVSISAFCNQCAPLNGQIVVDNVAFQK